MLAGDKKDHVVSLAHQVNVMARAQDDYRFSGSELLDLIKLIKSKDLIQDVAKIANSRNRVTARTQLEIMDTQSVRGAIQKMRSLIPGAFEGTVYLHA